MALPDGVTRVTEPFWKGIEEGVLLLQRCSACGRAQMYPRVVCTACGATTMVWERSMGIGLVHTFTIVRRAPRPDFGLLAPYVSAVVELEEGLRLLSCVVDVPVEQVAIGMRVRCIAQSVLNERALPMFTPL